MERGGSGGERNLRKCEIEETRNIISGSSSGSKSNIVMASWATEWVVSCMSRQIAKVIHDKRRLLPRTLLLRLVKMEWEWKRWRQAGGLEYFRNRMLLKETHRTKWDERSREMERKHRRAHSTHKHTHRPVRVAISLFFFYYFWCIPSSSQRQQHQFGIQR